MINVESLQLSESESVPSLAIADRIVKDLLCQMAGTVGAVENFIVEDGEIEGKTEADGV